MRIIYDKTIVTGMTALATTRTEPDLSFLLDRTSHVLRTRMAADSGPASRW